VICFPLVDVLISSAENTVLLYGLGRVVTINLLPVGMSLGSVATEFSVNGLSFAPNGDEDLCQALS
jgi:hypothetical protein